jgi:hypothetical protein
MQAIFNPDGTIRKVYDEAQHRHPASMTVDLTQEQAENIAAYQVNPQTKEVYLVPTCEAKYRKIVDNVILEMSAEEKATVDETENSAAVAAAEAAIIANLREIDVSSIRAIREFLVTLPDAPQHLQDHEEQAKIERAKL